MWIFFRYNNKDLMRDMGSRTFEFPVVITIQVASQPFIAPQLERGTELMLQDSREEPPKVVSKPCDSDSDESDVTPPFVACSA